MTAQLLLGETLDRLHQVRNQVQPALQRDVHLLPLRLVGFPLRHQLIARTHQAAAQDQHHQNDHTQRNQYALHMLLTPALRLNHPRTRPAY